MTIVRFFVSFRFPPEKKTNGSGLMEAWGRGIPDIFNESRTIDRHLAELQEKGFIVHEGSRKTGGYRVK